MTEQDPPTAEIWQRLVHALRSLLKDFAAVLRRDFDLTLAQFDALDAVSRSPGGSSSASDLAGALLYSSGSTTHLIRQLERRGLLTRDADAGDARRVVLRLTPSGGEIARRAQDAQRRLLAESFASRIAHDEEAETLLAFARRFPPSS